MRILKIEESYYWRMGEIASKQKAFDVIDLTEGKWKKEMEKLIPSKDKTNSKINIQLVGHEAVQHPWLMICDAKFHGEDIDVSETIPKERLPYERVKKPGMVIMIMGGGNCKFNPYYPDPRIKYITGVESNFNTTWKARQSIEGFIIEDFCRLDRNEYVKYLDVIYLGRDTQKWKSNIGKILDETQKYTKEACIKKRDVGKTKFIQFPWIAICGAEVESISSSLPELFGPREKLSGIVLMISPDEIEDDRIKSVFQDSYSGCEIKFMANVAFHRDFKKIRNEIMDLLLKDQKRESLSITGRDKTEGGEDRISVDSPVSSPDKLDMVEQCLLKFLPTDVQELSSSVDRCSSTESKPYQFLFKIGESILCVVHHVDEINSNAIKVCGNQNVGRQVHIIVEENGINDTLVINTQALSDIKRFLSENSSDEIDVIVPVQLMHDESATEYAFISSFLHGKIRAMKGGKVNFLQAENIPTHPWIFVCYAFDENDKFLKLKETLKDYGSMLLKVHGCQNIPKEAKIRNMANADNTTTIHLLMENDEIDDTLYMNDCAKAELRRIFERSSIGNIAGNTVQEEKVESKGVPFQDRKRIYIKCIANISTKAFTNFTERYITRIEPIWITGEDPIEEGSLCIVVCFTFSRLQDDIAAVVRVTPQGCKNMLVVIKNCQEGISPGSMLKSNPSNEFIDFTNILYNDGECYDCHINSLAREKVQAFIDNN